MAKKPMIWISDATKSVSSQKGFDQDVWVDNKSQAVDAMKRNEMGEPLPVELFPKEMYAENKDKREKNQRDLICASRFWTVSADCAEDLRQFNLGQGNFYSVEVFQHDRRKLVEGEYFYLNFGAQKTAVLTDQSSRIKKSYENYDIWQLPLAMQDNDIAIRSAAMSGSELWIDPQMRDTFFLSDAVVQALRVAKVSRPFKLSKCAVVRTSN